eukprot:1136304-Pelagomonas_calceolata.AAC.4
MLWLTFVLCSITTTNNNKQSSCSPALTGKEKENYAGSENTPHIKSLKIGYPGPGHRVSPSPREAKERSQWGLGGLFKIARADLGDESWKKSRLGL